MNIKNYISIFIALLCVKSFNILPVVTPTLPNNVTTKVFDRATGDLYLGLEGTEEGAAIIKFERFHGYGIPQYQTIVTSTEDSFIDGNSVEFLTLATSKGNVNPLLAVVAQSQNSAEQTKVLAYSNNFATDGKKASSSDLLDASGDPDRRGQTTAGIVGLAASATHIFAAVRPSGGDFGDNNGGVAVVKIAQQDSSITLAQTAARKNENPSHTGIKAKKVDTTTAELEIFSNPTIPSQSNDKPVCLHWDEKLQRLYIGITSIQTNAPDANNPGGTRSIIVAKVNTNNSMSFAAIAPHNAPDETFTPGSEKQIVGVIQENSNDPQLTIGALNIRTMHTSTGKSYLIVNGGNAVQVDGQVVVPTNRIFALPLVDKNDPTDQEQGTLADITDPTFTQIANNPSKIFTSESPEANVGSSPFPLLPETPPSNDKISDIVVVGDTVYISTVEPQDTDNESGVWYSQALFDENGNIYRWTPWTKRAFPIISSITKIKFFDVDAVNGKLWAIDDRDPSNAYTTAWVRANDDGTSDDLREVLNQDFQCGCFSVLDLDQSARGLAQDSPTRYALFGGMNQVAFVKISTSKATKKPYNRDTDTNTSYVQEVTTDAFNQPENYLLTALPTRAGCVKVLEFSRTFTTNYFFAGTQSGLYVFTDRTGKSFATVGNLNEEPFSTRRWQLAPNITGSIIDMKSDGHSLYVLTFETSRAKPIKNCLYRIDFKSNMGEMFHPDNIKKIAESATGSDLSAAKMFFAIQIITTKVGTDLINEIILATNNGIYRSNNNISDSETQEQAMWQQVDSNDTSMYTGIFAVDNIPTDTMLDYQQTSSHQHILSTVWPVQVADEQNCLTFEKSSVKQLNGSASQAPPKFIPVNFNATPSGNFETNKAFEALDPISYFWTDGARRFFIMQRVFDPNWMNKIFVIPYDINEWNAPNPDTMMLTDPALQQIKTFYWIRHIGATGILMAGTNSGVVSLE